MINETSSELNLRLLSDDDLIAKTKLLRSRETTATALLCAHLAEVHRRGLHLEFASNLYTYCATYLGLTDGEAAVRVQVAKGDRYPRLIRAMVDGSISLTVAAKLCPYLDRVGPDRLIEECRGFSKKQVEEHLVKYDPKPLYPESIRAATSRRITDKDGIQGSLSLEASVSPKMPNETPASDRAKLQITDSRENRANAKPKRKGEVKPATPEAYNFRFSASNGFKQKLDRLKELVCKNPGSSLEEVLEYALDYTLKNKDPEQRKQRRDRRHNSGIARPDDVTKKADRPVPKGGCVDQGPAWPSSSRRLIPRRTLDEVVARAGYQCEHRGKTGERCGERTGLEVDHIVALAFGGTSDPDNLQCLCASHHRLKTNKEMGRHFIAGKIAARKNSPEKVNMAG